MSPDEVRQHLELLHILQPFLQAGKFVGQVPDPRPEPELSFLVLAMQTAKTGNLGVNPGLLDHERIAGRDGFDFSIRERRAVNILQTFRSEGGLLPPDLLLRVVDPAGKISGVDPRAYGLPTSERLNEAITQSWNRLRRYWYDFRTGLTIDKWSLPLLR